MTNPEYNIVLTYCKIHFYLKFSLTNINVVPAVTVALGTLYTKLCVLVHSHDMIY